jgi:hypothetical protein
VHPTPAGSYLAGCVLYATLFRRSPAGLPAELRQNGHVLVSLEAGVANKLQGIAWEAIHKLDGMPYAPLKRAAARSRPLPDRKT